MQDEKEIWELIHREMFKRHPLGVYSAELCHARYLEKQTGTALPCVDEVENSPKEAAEMLRQRLQSKALIKNYQEQLPAFRESNPDI